MHVVVRLGLCCLTVAFCAEARGAILSANPSKDNTLFCSIDPNAQLSNGAGQHIFAGRTNQDSGTSSGTLSLRRGLVAFDVASIPASALVNSAKLTMYQDRSPDTRTFTISVHQ